MVVRGAELGLVTAGIAEQAARGIMGIAGILVSASRDAPRIVIIRAG